MNVPPTIERDAPSFDAPVLRKLSRTSSHVAPILRTTNIECHRPAEMLEAECNYTSDFGGNMNTG